MTQRRSGKVFILLMLSLQVLQPRESLAASSFDGIFTHATPSQVEYFSLTEVGNQVSGFYYAIAADSRLIEGLKESRINISGISDGNTVNFREGQGDFSSTLGWAARASWNGFNLSFPTNGGYLNEEKFTRSSASDLNIAISSLRQSVGQRQAYEATVEQSIKARNALQSAQNQLAHDLAQRPEYLQAMIKAKAELRKAQGELDHANSVAATKQAEYDDAKQKADEANDTAETPDEHTRVNDLRLIENDRNVQLFTAKTDVFNAKSDTYNAQNNLNSAHRALSSLDSQIVTLHQVINRISQYIGSH